jgi:glycerol-3-phosphate dehydrogenase subunit C
MDQCTKCGICQAHCPVMSVTNEFPGPKYAGPQAERFRVIGTAVDNSPELCTGCGICTSVCPNGVSISDIITIAKAENLMRGKRISVGQKLLNRPDLIGKTGGLVPFFANAALRNSLLRGIANSLLGIHTQAALPRIRGNEFRQWFKNHDQPEGVGLLYFPGCAVDNFDPRTGIAVVRVLNSMGYKVRLSVQSCCSLPMLSSGEWKPTRNRARLLIDTLASDLAPGETLVTSSTSCGLTLKSKYCAYLSMDDANTRHVSSSTKDICEFIGNSDLKELQGAYEPVKRRIFYHPPCQLRAHGIGFPALELLSEIPALEVIVSESSCCGIGGTYGYTSEKHMISKAIAKPLSEQIAQIFPDLIACDSETCRWHLSDLTGITAVHPVELMANINQG